MWTSQYRERVAIHSGNPSPSWAGEVDGANRILYVGVTVNLLKRLDEHLNNSGSGPADFTKVFPPIRILNVNWYPSYQIACQAERITADLLAEEFPEDFVAQPG
ncbi:GIY-YIG nuclease family protein [Halobacterium wangiae]|uniref:GIY-YIG nuclease family protein n=1 Tax=Halobacterium wangiae TaxID=2902623 RepID=UPI0022B7C4E4|nr:GIY-YIG nuclease family protein [Halobacterium wangiae]